MTDYANLIERLRRVYSGTLPQDAYQGAAAIESLIAERDAYQQAADKMAAEHKVEREALERQIKIKDGEAEMYKSYWKQATDANRKIRNAA